MLTAKKKLDYLNANIAELDKRLAELEGRLAELEARLSTEAKTDEEKLTYSQIMDEWFNGRTEK